MFSAPARKYQANREGYERRASLVATIKTEAGCTDCGERDPLVLEFDHLDPSTKSAALRTRRGRSIVNLGYVSILEEIEKCDVVCANDHRRREAGRR